MYPTDFDWLKRTFGGDKHATTVGAGEVLFRAGDIPEYLYLVLAGKAQSRCPDSMVGEIVTQCSHPGELFAESGLFLPEHRCDGYCPVASRLLGIPLDDVRARVADDGDFALRFMGFMAMALSQRCLKYERMLLKTDDRVLHYLGLEAAGSFPATVAIDVTYKEWAAQLGMDNATLSRTLARLETKGLIARAPTRRHCIRIGSN